MKKKCVPAKHDYFDCQSILTDIRHKAIKGAGFTILTRGLNTVLQMGSTIALARLLVPADFGLVSMVTAFSFLLFNVGFNGFTEAIIQKDSITHRDVNALFWLGLGVSMLLALIFSCCSPLLAWFYHEPRVIPIAVVLSTGFIFSAAATEHQALVKRSLQLHKLLVCELISMVLSIAIAVGLALKGYGYWAIVSRQLSYFIISCLVYWIQCSWRPGLPSFHREIIPMVKYASNTFGNFLVSYFGRNLDKVLIGWRFGSNELGSYDRAYYLFMMPVNQMTSPLTDVALATMSRYKNDPIRFRGFYIKALSIISLLGFLISAIMTVSGTDLIYFLLGPHWAKTGRIFSAFGPSIGISMVYGTHGWLHLSKGRADTWFRWGIIALVATFLFFIAGLPFGTMGVAVAYSISFYVLAIPGLWYAGKVAGIHPVDFLAYTWKHMVAALLSGLGAWYMVYQLPALSSFLAGQYVLVRILSVVGICTVFDAIATIVLHGSLRPLRELVEFAQEFVRRKKETIPESELAAETEVSI